MGSIVTVAKLRKAAMVSETGKRVDERIHVHSVDEFQVHSVIVETSKHHALALDGSSKHDNRHRAKEVDSDVGEKRKVCLETTSRKRAHYGWNWLAGAKFKNEAFPNESVNW